MRVRLKGALASVVVLIATTLSVTGGAHAAGLTTPPDAPADAATTYQINSVHDGVATTSMSAPLQKAWSRDLGATVSYPVVVNGRVFVVTPNANGSYGTRLWALDANDGSVLWGPMSLGGLYGFSGIAADGANVYTVTFGGLLTAFSQSTGAQVWSAQLPYQYAFTSPPTVRHGVVYVGGAGSGGTLYAVAAGTGAILWTANVENGDHSSPAVTDDGVYVSYACGVTYRFAPASGLQAWARYTGCEGGGGKTPVVHDGKVYVRDFSYPGVLDAATGAVVGSFTSSTTPAFSGSIAYLLQGATLRAVDTATNQVLWSQAGDGSFDSAPVVLGSEIAMGSSTGRVALLNADTGAIDWSEDAGSPILGPDEQNADVLVGLTASGGRLFVPASNTLVAYTSVRANTTTGVVAMPAHPGFLQKVTLVAVINPAAATGTASFTLDGSSTPLPGCGSDPVVRYGSSAVALCQVSGLALGTHVYTARYGGDASYAPSSGTGSVTVGRGVTVMAPKPALVTGSGTSQGVTMYARLSAYGTPLPGQHVIFTSGGRLLCISDTAANGYAMCRLKPLSNVLRVILVVNGFRARFLSTPEFQASNAIAKVR